MHGILRRLLSLIAYGVLIWSLPEVLRHRSDSAKVFGRYSLSYFTWVSLYLVIVIAWTAVTIFVFLRRQQAPALRERLAPYYQKAYLLGVAIPLPLLAFTLVANQPGALPLAFVLAGALFTMAWLGTAPAASKLGLKDTAHVVRLEHTSLSERINAVARWLAGGRRSEMVSLTVITLTALTLFAPVLLKPDRLVGGHDLPALYYVVERYTTEVIHAGKLPLWNPYMFSGLPLLAHPDSMVFYPIQVVLRSALPVSLAVAWGFAIHIWIAGAGMYALCRYLRLRPWIALICALAFMLNGGLLTRILAGHIWLVYALSWLPLAWLLVMLALERGSAIALVGAGLVIAMTILTGHPTLPAYMLLFLGLFWLFHAVTVWQAEKTLRQVVITAVRFGAILVLAFGFAAIQLLPSLVFSSQTSLASGYAPGDAALGTLSLHHLAMIFLPDAYPYPGLDIWEQFPYLGILLPLAAPWAFARPERRSLAVFLGLVALVSVVLAFGQELRLFSLLYYLLPPFRLLRIPPRALVMWIPSLVLLGGLGLETLMQRGTSEGRVACGTYLYQRATLLPLGILSGFLLARATGIDVLVGLSENRQTLITATILGAVLAICMLTAGAPLYPGRGSHRGKWAAGALLAANILLGFVLLPRAIPAAVAPSGIVLGFGKLAILLLVIGFLLPVLFRFPGASITSLLLIIVVFLDMYTFGAKYVAVSDVPSLRTEERQALAVIPPPPQGRVMRGDAPLAFNALVPLGISNIDGYYSGIMSGYTSFLRGLSANPPPETTILLSYAAYPEIDERALDFLNVTHVFSKEPLAAPGRELVAEVPGRYAIYRNPDALPRAFWVGNARVIANKDDAIRAMLDPGFDYRSTVLLENPVPAEGGSLSDADVTITEYDGSSGGFVIQASTPRAGVLVLSEPYYSERHASLDGREVPLLRANVGFSAIALPAGTHQVRISYVPTSLYQGILITVGTAVVAVGLVMFSLFRRGRYDALRRPPRPPVSTALSNLR